MLYCLCARRKYTQAKSIPGSLLWIARRLTDVPVIDPYFYEKFATRQYQRPVAIYIYMCVCLCVCACVYDGNKLCPEREHSIK